MTHGLVIPMHLFHCSCGESFITLAKLYDHVDAHPPEQDEAS